ncbi:MAG: hypothetical protein J3K34DRAFT_422662 [Monoraphidium minutum]|nr:MAG: hypothetical protein J3K34DRAFT_422662 [Monoraphidium minutum]
MVWNRGMGSGKPKWARARGARARVHGPPQVLNPRACAARVCARRRLAPRLLRPGLSRLRRTRGAGRRGVGRGALPCTSCTSRGGKQRGGGAGAPACRLGERIAHHRSQCTQQGCSRRRGKRGYGARGCRARGCEPPWRPGRGAGPRVWRRPKRHQGRARGWNGPCHAPSAAGGARPRQVSLGW